jgi:hypothetical protein
VYPPAVDQNGYGPRVPGIVISPYARRGLIDHQILSHDAYNKFIEDVFMGGARLDPATDGRPDPRPDVRENEPLLGNLLSDFDFSQRPLPPVLLSPTPPPGQAAHLMLKVRSTHLLALRADRPAVTTSVTCNDVCLVTVNALLVTVRGRVVGRAAGLMTERLAPGRAASLVLPLRPPAARQLARGPDRRVRLTFTFHSRIGPLRIVRRTLSAPR